MRGVLIILSTILATTLASAQIECTSGDCINGQGACIYPSGARYEGQFREGKPNGKGTLSFSDGREYIGDWKNGYRHGMGILSYPNGDKFTGEFDANLFDGRGIMAYANGNRYEGPWQDGKQEGRGVFFFANGDRYEGQFRQGLCEGEGVMFYSDGSIYSGQWANNVRHGRGKLSFPDGEEITGEWDKGQYLTDWSKLAYQGDTANLPNCNLLFCNAGPGKYTYGDGSVYVGDFYNGMPEGSGTVYYASGNRYEGGWKQHTPHGRGVMYYNNGRIVGAIWDFGKPIKKLFEQGESEGPTPIPIDRDAQVKIWAVVVGAATYTHMPPLRYTDDDAYQLYAFLKSPEGGALPDEQVRLLIDEQATRKNILNAMRSVFLRADENDVIIFYFSGHGLQGAFLPVDFDGYNNQLKHEEIKALLEESKAKHKIVLADACHSGSLLSMKTPLQIALKRYYEAFEQSSGGTALLMSSKGEEYSLEDGGLRSGIFSHFLVLGLKGAANQNGDDLVTIQELFDYVHQNVRMYTGNVQTPTLTGIFDPNMPVAFVREAATAGKP
ncbi:MAG TPA: caspase family protein [Saprospiraceae bacterium]|nr:caspase family protein [Lewinellaceae bacterium]HQU59254.1 caspase family protein [Saprospiraceae bacterium]